MLTRLPNIGEMIEITNAVTGVKTVHTVIVPPTNPRTPTELSGIIWFMDSTGKTDCIIAKFPNDRYNVCIKIVSR